VNSGVLVGSPMSILLRVLNVVLPPPK